MFRPHMVVAVLVLAGGGPVAAGELANCYVGRLPCGTPAQMAETIRRCLGTPALCGEAAAARMAPGAAAPPVAAAGAVAGAAAPAVVVVGAVAGAAAPRSLAAAAAPRAGGTGWPAEPSVTAIGRVERALPLPEELAALRDAVPANPAAIMHRLGLRASAAPAVDFRGRVPTVEELVLALLP
ncbi:hypothetical protein [Siccirubricoccus phaeus]|uniref:hypothetical protein n=1 Tax=Siccirubricoccus phaeus TaxID=2595053 RepID=UPI00165A1EBE|nr:hypothetical protein [Siccirubricoccus phaeus]